MSQPNQGLNGAERDLPPETRNAEQDDGDTQAQTVAGEAMERDTAVLGLSDSDKDGGGLEDTDAQDLVDHMNQMDSSGSIDMSAYDGEESHDDLENAHGRRQAPDKDFRDDDS